MKSEKYMLDKRGFFAKASLFCLILAVILRAIGGVIDIAVLRVDRFMLVEFLLPLICCIFLMIFILAFSKRGFWLSAIPVVCFGMSFVLRLFSYDNLQQIDLAMLVKLAGVFGCMAISAVYSATVFGARTKWLMFLLLLAGLAAHIWLEVVPAFQIGGWLSAAPVLMECSLLCIFLAGLFLTLGLTHSLKSKPGKPLSEKAPSAPVTKPEEKLPVVSEPKETVASESIPASPATDSAKSDSTPKAADPQTNVEHKKEPAEENAVPAMESQTEDDPFAPSSGPIKLTLTPAGFTSATEQDTDEGSHS